jgi:glycosyltransferase involved in cell wall biosynthesis
MACDIPSVVTNVGDAAILVGNTGVVVPAKDPAALAAGLKKCIENFGLHKASSPRQRIIDEFSVDLLVARTETALASLIRC